MKQRFIMYSDVRRGASRWLAVLLLACGVLSWAGCDSSGSDDDDVSADAFLGTWEAVSLRAGILDVLGSLELTAIFGPADAVRITVVDGDDTVADFTGTFEVDSRNDILLLSSSEFDEDLETDFEFVSENELNLTFSGGDLEQLGIDLGGFGGIVGGLSITAVLERQN